MTPTIVSSPDELASLSGKPLGSSRWITVSQSVIDSFADATFDHQWIHVDTERASAQPPLHSTIAHGFLTLSLLTTLLEDVIQARQTEKIVNSAVKDMRFLREVSAGSRLRLTATVARAKAYGRVCQMEMHCVFEIEGTTQPVAEGTVVYLYFFND